MSLVPGTRIGPFEVVSPLGIGGMGEVYRARDTRLGRDVALKGIAPASTAPHPGLSVMNCGGIGTGAGPGTLNVAKHVVRLICRPFLSRPEASAKPARLA